MQILIRGKLATIKKGTSFNYVSENRLFTGADDYTLSITFPLADCQANREIFGYLNRPDVEKDKIILDCEIVDKQFYKSGSLAIVEVSDTEVKTQFLEGRSEQNFDQTLDDIYINNLTISDGDGADDGSNRGREGLSRGESFDADDSIRTHPITTPVATAKPKDAWDPTKDFVALPWVNNETGILQNEVKWDSASNSYVWADPTKKLSWQMYLLPLAKALCQISGYTFDFSAWENSPYKYLLCCNTLPQAWDINEVARALPHWTVTEFFEKLELLMCCEFNIDHRIKKISCEFSADVVAAIPDVEIKNVVDEFTAEVTFEDKDIDNDYIRAQNLAFAEADYPTWPYEACEWYVKNMDPSTWSKGRYDTFAALVDANKGMKQPTHGWGTSYRGYAMINYDVEDDLFVSFRCVDKIKVEDRPLGPVYNQIYVLQPINRFGPLINNPEEEAETAEVEFVPVPIDYTDSEHGFTMFIPGASHNESSSDNTDTSIPNRLEDPDGYAAWAAKIVQPDPLNSINAGEKDEKSEYFSVIYTAFFDGTLPTNHHNPIPVVDNILIYSDWSFIKKSFSLRLNAKKGESSTYRSAMPEIDARVKYKFSFLSDYIPNSRAVFNIRGKRYLCQKLTATFTEEGMSQLIKGEFYMIKD